MSATPPPPLGPHLCKKKRLYLTSEMVFMCSALAERRGHVWPPNHRVDDVIPAAATTRAASASVRSVTVGRFASFASRWKPRLRLRVNCNFKHKWDGKRFVSKEISCFFLFFFRFVIPQLACGHAFGCVFKHLCHTHVAPLHLRSPYRKNTICLLFIAVVLVLKNGKHSAQTRARWL